MVVKKATRRVDRVRGVSLYRSESLRMASRHVSVGWVSRNADR